MTAFIRFLRRLFRIPARPVMTIPEHYNARSIVRPVYRKHID